MTVSVKEDFFLGGEQETSQGVVGRHCSNREILIVITTNIGMCVSCTYSGAARKDLKLLKCTCRSASGEKNHWAIGLLGY